MRRNILPLTVLVLAGTQQPYGADRESAIADGRRLYGCRRRLRAGRGRGRFPAERQRACFLFCHREARFRIPDTQYCKPVK